MVNSSKIKDAINQFEKCSQILVALGDSNRQQLILGIVAAGIEGINVQNLAAKTNLSRPAVSHHLKILRDTGLISPIKKGTQNFYRVRLIKKLNEIKVLGTMIENLVKDLDEEELTEFKK